MPGPQVPGLQVGTAAGRHRVGMGRREDKPVPAVGAVVAAA